MIDIAAYNALVLWITRNEQWNRGKSSSRREFLRELGLQLVRGHARQRAQQPLGKRRRLLEAARRSGVTRPDVPTATCSDGRKRCRRMCPSKLEHKTTRTCDMSGSSICKDHYEVVMRCWYCVEAAETAALDLSEAETTTPGDA